MTLYLYCTWWLTGLIDDYHVISWVKTPPSVAHITNLPPQPVPAKCLHYYCRQQRALCCSMILCHSREELKRWTVKRDQVTLANAVMTDMHAVLISCTSWTPLKARSSSHSRPPWTVWNRQEAAPGAPHCRIPQAPVQSLNSEQRWEIHLQDMDTHYSLSKSVGIWGLSSKPYREMN